MNDNVRKVFDILGVEPNEKFKIEGNGDTIYYIDEELYIHRNNQILCCDSLSNLINGYFKIIKLQKKKKLRDLTEEEYRKWLKKNCSNLSCKDCVFLKAKCNTNSLGCWVNNKDFYSDKFLDQEVEVEE